MKRLACILSLTFTMLLFPIAAFAEGAAADESQEPGKEYFYWNDFVNAGLDTGFSESNEIGVDDPHFGWELGRFSTTGYTRDILDDPSKPIFLKDSGSAITLSFECTQDDIDHLNGNPDLSVSGDTDGYDKQLGIERTDFGRGTMIVKHVDRHNESTPPIIYTDYLSAESAPQVKIEEEGDYVAVFDYEIFDKSKLLFDTIPNPVALFAPAYWNYQVRYDFSVRNSDCMVYPFDIETGEELINCSYTATGLPVDELKEKVAGGAIITDSGAVFDKGEDNWNDSAFLEYVGDLVYDQVVDEVGEGVFVENVQVQYLSREYLKAIEGNSKSNEYFGLTASEIDDAISGDRFVLTQGDDGKTDVRAFQPHDDSTERIVKNVAIGGGVVLVCVAVSAATGGAAAPSCVAVIASSAADGAIGFSLMSGAIGGVAAGVAKGYETGDVEQALKAAAVEGSEGFKMGAITGALFGAGDAAVGIASKAASLRGVKLAEGFSVKDAAVVQQAAKAKGLNWTKGTIKELSSLDEANIYLTSELKELNINGRKVLTSKNINWKLKDKDGITNAERLNSGEAPIEKVEAGKNVSFEVHHIGQKNDSMFAIMKKADHRGAGNNSILHPNRTSDVEHGSAFDTIKRELFEGVGKAHSEGLV